MRIKFIVASLALLANSAFAGAITNGDFATGDLTGWTANGPVSVIKNGTINVADLFAGLGKDVYTTLTQTLHLDAGDVLTGNAQFFAHDYVPYNDDAYVTINGTNLFYSSVGNVGNYGTSALTGFTYNVATTGDYLLTAAVANHGDNNYPSELQVSNFAVASAVPEPMSIALLGLGLLGLATARRKTLKK